MTLPTAASWRPAPSTDTAPFADGGKVVANTAVGFGPPETVTVAEPDTGVEVPFAESEMVNWGEDAYMMPFVELTKRRK